MAKPNYQFEKRQKEIAKKKKKEEKMQRKAEGRNADAEETASETAVNEDAPAAE